MPTFHIELFEGRSVEQKRELVAGAHERDVPRARRRAGECGHHHPGREARELGHGGDAVVGQEELIAQDSRRVPRPCSVQADRERSAGGSTERDQGSAPQAITAAASAAPGLLGRSARCVHDARSCGMNLRRNQVVARRARLIVTRRC